MDSFDLVSLIEAELKRRGISKAEFYSATGISSATFSQWRKRIYYPSSTAIKKIENYLGIKLKFRTKEEKPATETGDELDATTRELLNLAATLDPADVHMLLDMAKAIKARRKDDEK